MTYTSPWKPNPDDHELVQQLDRIRFDLTSLQGKVTEAQRMAASLKLEPHEPHICPECKHAGITHDLRTAAKLSNHRRYSHGVDTHLDGTCPQCDVAHPNHAADCPTLQEAAA